MSRTVDYYFAPQSPWTYLGHARFAAGCIVDLTYAERTTATTLTEPTLGVLARWRGNHMLTGPRQSAAGWTQAVILIRPETTEPRRH